MSTLDFSVAMHPCAGFAMGPQRRNPQIRIAPSASDIGRWEWAVFEESRAQTSGELANAQATREVFANGVEPDPMQACFAAVSAFDEIMRRPVAALGG